MLRVCTLVSNKEKERERERAQIVMNVEKTGWVCSKLPLSTFVAS